MKLVRGNHPNHYRSGEWAKLVTTLEHEGKRCYLVEFADKATDFWPVNDPNNPLEIKDMP